MSISVVYDTISSTNKVEISGAKKKLNFLQNIKYWLKLGSYILNISQTGEFFSILFNLHRFLLIRLFCLEIQKKYMNNPGINMHIW